MTRLIYLVRYFDGACQCRKCGCGAVIILELAKYFHFWWEGRHWTNSRPEIIDLWRVLTCAKWLLLQNIMNIMIEDIMIYGEGKGIIDWIKYYTLFIILSLLTG